jgi:hypothetical protein
MIDEQVVSNSNDTNSVNISNTDVPVAVDQQFMLRSEREGLLKVVIDIIKVVIFLLHYKNFVIIAKYIYTYIWICV